MQSTDAIFAALRTAGMREETARDKARLFEQAAAHLGSGPVLPLFVPGRIEVLGKHTDYAGGRSIVCTVERGICFAVRPRTDQRLRVFDVAGGSWFEGTLASDSPPVVDSSWVGYLRAVIRRLVQNFPGPHTGADISFVSDLPPAAGLSSSSALIVGFFLALARANRLADSATYHRELGTTYDLAGYLGTIENGRSFGELRGDRGVGTFGGSQDHAAILLGRPGQLSMLSFCPLRPRGLVPLPPGHTFVVAGSGVRAEKTGAAREAYNAVSMRVTRLLEQWNARTGRADACLADALRSDPTATARLTEYLAGEGKGHDAELLLQRLEQFVLESERLIPSAFAALVAGDIDSFGRVVADSQHAAETLLHNQIPQTRALVRAGRACAAAAVSCFGAGFGGSAWALIKADEAAEFARRWIDRYRGDVGPTPSEPAAFVTAPGIPARWLDA